MPSDTKINEENDCFCKIHLGDNTQSSQKSKFKDGKIAFNETLNLKTNNEKTFKLSFWYTEKDSSYVLIGTGELNFAGVEGIKQKLIENQINILKDGKENGLIEVKMLLIVPAK